jgi:hypothetical protein
MFNHGMLYHIYIYKWMFYSYTHRMYPYTHIYIMMVDISYFMMVDCVYIMIIMWGYHGMYHHIPYIDIPILYPMYIIRNHVFCVYDPDGSKYVRKFIGYEDDMTGVRGTFLGSIWIHRTNIHVYIYIYTQIQHHETS